MQKNSYCALVVRPSYLEFLFVRREQLCNLSESTYRSIDRKISPENQRGHVHPAQNENQTKKWFMVSLLTSFSSWKVHGEIGEINMSKQFHSVVRLLFHHELVWFEIQITACQSVINFVRCGKRMINDDDDVIIPKIRWETLGAGSITCQQTLCQISSPNMTRILKKKEQYFWTFM